MIKPNFHLLDDNQKISLIKQFLSAGSPIIILGERDQYEHYITLLGFDSSKNQYFIYDSLQPALPEQKGMTTDDNPGLPGNNTLNSQELSDFWRGGGMYRLWT